MILYMFSFLETLGNIITSDVGNLCVKSANISRTFSKKLLVHK